MERVFLCTPLRGIQRPQENLPDASKLTKLERDARERALNITFARRCMIECLGRGQAPMAPHLLYPRVLDDNEPKDRELGMRAGRAWLIVCASVECYIDRGVSEGMRGDLRAAIALGMPIHFRTLAGPPPTEGWLHKENVPHHPCTLCAMLRGGVASEFPPVEDPVITSTEIDRDSDLPPDLDYPTPEPV